MMQTCLHVEPSTSFSHGSRTNPVYLIAIVSLMGLAQRGVHVLLKHAVDHKVIFLNAKSSSKLVNVVNFVMHLVMGGHKL
jgi:hypothetical protein